MDRRTRSTSVTTDSTTHPRFALASVPADRPAGSPAYAALQAAVAANHTICAGCGQVTSGTCRRCATPGRVAAEGLTDALSEYGRVSAYTAGPDATPVTVTVAGRTIRLDLAPSAVEALTLAAYSTAEDLIRDHALDAPVVPTLAGPVAPIVRRPALSVLPGGAA